MTGNRTGDPLLHRPELSPLGHTSQGLLSILKSLEWHSWMGLRDRPGQPAILQVGTWGVKKGPFPRSHPMRRVGRGQDSLCCPSLLLLRAAVCKAVALELSGHQCHPDNLPHGTAHRGPPQRVGYWRTWVRLSGKTKVGVPALHWAALGRRTFLVRVEAGSADSDGPCREGSVF